MKDIWKQVNDNEWTISCKDHSVTIHLQGETYKGELKIDNLTYSCEGNSFEKVERRLYKYISTLADDMDILKSRFFFEREPERIKWKFHEPTIRDIEGYYYCNYDNYFIKVFKNNDLWEYYIEYRPDWGLEHPYNTTECHNFKTFKEASEEALEMIMPKYIGL